MGAPGSCSDRPPTEVPMADADAPLASRINYAQCWEDPRLLREALAPTSGRRILSIASAGDNSIDLALAGAEVVAVDLSGPQLALSELKLACGHLPWEQARALFGLGPDDRAAAWLAVRPHLGPGARAFWDAHHRLIGQGLLDAGRFERYLATFRERILPLVHRPRDIARWVSLSGLAEQERFYRETWDTWRWRALFRLFFSQRVMAARGRSPEQFTHVDGAVSQSFLARARGVFTGLPVRDNPYLQWMLLGRWVHPEAEPRWISRAGHARLLEAASRIELVYASLDEHLAGVGDGTYDGANLSDLFEYLTPEHTAALLAELARASSPGARLAYWNLLVDRRRPPSLAHRLEPLDDLASRLFARDRAFVYRAFRVEEVL